MLKMKTIVCVKPDEFQLIETEEPIAQAGEVLVRIKRIGICGTDLHAYKGNQPFFSYPRILGHELSGIVEVIGDKVIDFKAGDQVTVMPYLECGSCIACRNGKTNCCTSMRVLGVHIDGGMRELVAIPADHLLHTNGLSLDQSAIIEPLSIGAHAVRRSGLKQGEYTLVIGGGPIGLGVMALAKHQGAKVIAMDINEERLAIARSWARVDYIVNALNNPKETITEITGGDFPTIVFDATGNTRSMMDAFQYAAHGGKLIFVGLVKTDISFSDPEFHKKELTLMASRNATREDFDIVLEAVRSGSLDADRYITHRVGFEQMIGQFESYLNPQTKVLKAMVEL
jgi:2-desacetyl-2-hydroxyethyl bacteriochlorophyllide A dehydrogenase